MPKDTRDFLHGLIQRRKVRLSLELIIPEPWNVYDIGNVVKAVLNKYMFRVLGDSFGVDKITMTSEDIIHSDDKLCGDCYHSYRWHFESNNLPSGRTGCGNLRCECLKFK